MSLTRDRSIERAVSSDADPLEAVVNLDPRPEDLPRPPKGASARVRATRMVRATLRVTLLVAADSGMFLLARSALGNARAGTFGSVVAGVAHRWYPVGSIWSWQLWAALILSLVVVGAYGTGHQRRDVGRIMAGAGLAALLTSFGPLWEGASLRFLLGSAFMAGALGLLLVLERAFVDALTDLVPWLRHRVVVVRPEGGSHDAPNLGPRFETVGVLTDPQAQLIPDALERWAHGADTVVLNGELSREQMAVLVDEVYARRWQFLEVPDAPELVGVLPRWAWIRGRPYLDLTPPGLSAAQSAVKRMIDLVGSSLMLLILSPAMLLLAWWVRRDSPGPALFRQTRIGRGGSLFTCLKFRTMRQDAEDMLRADPDMMRRYVDNGFKLPPDEDPRVTHAGRILRRTSLDELPQLINVLRGEMSLVGPRPIVPGELVHYGEIRHLFLSMKPGLTGIWAVQGRSNVGYPERAHIEVEYARDWSILRDVWILLKTVPAVFMQNGAH